MPLELIHGPPGSGRVVSILDRYVGSIAADPVLVVPTSDDVDRLERELCERPTGILGGTVTTLPGLFREVGHELGIEEGSLLTRLQRIRLARAAAAETSLRRLARSSAHSGFAPALERLLSDLQSAGLDAAGFALAVESATELGDGEYEREIAALFTAYERRRDALGLGDRHQHAATITAALRAEPRRWRERPVLLYGFDDLDREQIELIAALSAGAPVTVAVAYEDRPALAARAELLGALRDELGGTIAETRRVEPDQAVRPSPTLRHLERNLFEPEAPPLAPAVETDGSLHLLEGAGERSTIELIGRRIAALLATGTDPDEIAVAVRNPDANGAVIARTFAELGIPTAAEARIPLLNTATGAALDELLTIAAGEGTAESVVSLLRRPARAWADNVDRLEREVLRERIETAADALGAWADAGGEEPRRVKALEDLRAAGDDPVATASVLSRFAADVAERTHARSAFVPSGTDALELRAAGVVGKALAEVCVLGGLAPRRPDELRQLLEGLRVPLWSGPTEGRVRVLSPYRLRGTRVAHLFVADLTDGAFPAPSAGDPLLSDERRRALGLPGRGDPAAEERYLFYVCVAKPEISLSLAYPAADDDGRALARSPFVDEVRGLLSPPPTPEAADDPIEAKIAQRAQLTDFVPAPEGACSPRDLARALAASGAPEKHLEALDLEGEGAAIAARVLESVQAAGKRTERAREPGPLRDPDVLATLGGIDAFGASTLEGYHVCSYRWFVSHELRPRSIEPDPEPLETGGIMHEALERLYREGPAGTRRPEPGNVRRWIARGEELLAEVASGREWNLDSSAARITLRRLDAILERFLRRDAATGGPMQPDPELLEARFDRDDEARFPLADLGEFRLRGAIDRIDVADGRALIRDYKLSASVTPVAKFIELGRLQLPLYMLAARQFGLDPIGGLYSPLAATKEADTRPRGLLADAHVGTLVPGEKEHHVSRDYLDEEEFEQAIADGLEEATRIVRSIRGGEIDRNPRKGACPPYCEYAPICRMERTLPVQDDEEEEIV